MIITQHIGIWMNLKFIINTDFIKLASRNTKGRYKTEMQGSPLRLKNKKLRMCFSEIWRSKWRCESIKELRKLRNCNEISYQNYLPFKTEFNLSWTLLNHKNRNKPFQICLSSGKGVDLCAVEVLHFPCRMKAIHSWLDRIL